MALPGITNLILDGGIGVTTPASSTPHVVGVCEQGPSSTPTVVANPRILRETFGVNGPAVDAAGYILATAGGPIIFTRTAEGVAATYDDGGGAGSTGSMVSSSGAGVDNEIDLDVATTAPKNDYALLVKIVVGGALADTTMQYSLDGGVSYSPTIDAGASIALGTSGVTLEMEVGSTAPYVAGATYSAVVKAPHYSAANLTTVFDAVDLSLLSFDFYVFAGEAVDGAGAATLFSTVVSRLNSSVTKDRYYGAIMGAGDDTPAAALTAWAALVGERVAPVYGSFRTAPAFGHPGRALPHMPLVNAAAARAAGNVMSTDLAQTSGATSVGPLAGASDLSHNEYLAEAGLDAAKVGTGRTYANLTGIFLTNVWMKSGVGSDFEYWQHRRMMDEACKVVSQQHALLVSSNVITKTDGTGSLFEPSALAIEKRVQRALDNVIGSAVRGVGPTTVDGTTGHVSDIAYQVDRTNNVLSTKQLIATISIVPRGYLKTLSTTLSYKLQV